MPEPIPIKIDGKDYKVQSGRTVLEVCRENGVDLPTLCHLEGLGTVGACRLCLVEMDGSPKLFPACTTPVAPNQVIRTQTDKLQQYRRMITELLFSERNHVCAVCVSNGDCELQDLGYRVGMDHVRFPYLFPDCATDASHKDFVMDHNRCILCTRCVRVCDEVESAHNWDVAGRGFQSRIIADFNQPWGESITCTGCGKCIEVCPTGALWPKDASIGRLHKRPESISELVAKRRAGA
jgi:bidirectional [NiFe] hydrogenase diaphorase subunit